MDSRDVSLAALENLLEQAVQTQNTEPLLSDRALGHAAALARSAGDGDDLRVSYALGMFHWFRYLVLPAPEDRQDFEIAVRFLAEVYQANPDSVPEELRPYFADDATGIVAETATRGAASLLDSFQRTGELPCLVEAVSLFRSALSGTPVGHPFRAAHLNNLGVALQMLYERTGEMAVLAEAVDVNRAAVATVADDDPDRATCLGMLGAALLALFERTGDAETLAEAVKAGRQAVATAGPDHAERATHLTGLGIMLQRLSFRTGDMGALAEAVDFGRQAVAAAADPGEKAAALNNLGAVLLTWSGRTGDGTALAEAVDLGRRAVESVPEDHPDRAAYLGNLGSALAAVADRTGETATLTEAAQVARAAATAVPDDHPARAACLNNLGNTLHQLFKRTGELATLIEAVAANRSAVEALSEDHPDRIQYLANHSAALQSLFQRTGDATVLAEAVAAGRESVAAVPDDHPLRIACLVNLSSALQALFEQTGDAAVLAESVRYGRQAVAATPEGHPDLALSLGSLGNALQALFDRTGDTDLLVEAVEAHRQALAAAPEGPGRVGHLGNLGVTLRMLFVRTGSVAALVEAVEAGRQTVAATPDDDPVAFLRLSNFSVALQELFEATEEVTALVEAAEVGRRAIAVVPGDHPYRGNCQNNLGNSLQLLFQHSGDASVLIEAVQVYREALALVPDEHPDRAGRLSNLGGALHKRYESGQDPDGLRAAADCFQAAAALTTAGVSVRIQALRQVAILADTLSPADGKALEAAESMTALLPQISPRTLARADREFQVDRLGSVAEAAVSAALVAGRPQRAVELLEATRGVLVADVLDARGGDLDRLREHAPEWAREFQELRDLRELLDRPDPGLENPKGSDPAGLTGSRATSRTAQELARSRQTAQAEWDALLSRIRALPGLSGFLMPPGIAELAGQASRGPIVFLIAGPARCDALILTGDAAEPLRVVSLDRLTQDEALTRANQLLEARRTATDVRSAPTTRKTAQQEILDVLAWLWDTVAEPVLTALGRTDGVTAGQPWPRVWWCPVGVMAYLPVHAAGHHRDLLAAADAAGPAARRTVLDRVISSYTPTVRALAHARSRQPATAGPALIVAVPDAPELAPLPGVVDEAEAVAALIPDSRRPEHPVRADVLRALPTHPVVHLSCHGVADWKDPAASRLMLYDYQTAPLTVADISALRLTGTLAFLSACDTASAGPRLTDEALHLTGAFHLAGYQNVIGTQWPVDERAAGRVATEFYARLTAGGTVPPDTTVCAYALHQAVRLLRSEYPNTPTHWAAHTHTGT